MDSLHLNTIINKINTLLIKRGKLKPAKDIGNILSQILKWRNSNFVSYIVCRLLLIESTFWNKQKRFYTRKKIGE